MKDIWILGFAIWGIVLAGLLIFASICKADEPSLYGSVDIHFSIVSEPPTPFIIPEVFTKADKIYIVTKNDGGDQLLFFNLGNEFAKYNVNERTGVNDAGVNICWFSHSPDHICFDYIDRGVKYKFRSSSVIWHHDNIASSFLSFTFGGVLRYEVNLREDR